MDRARRHRDLRASDPRGTGHHRERSSAQIVDSEPITQDDDVDITWFSQEIDEEQSNLRKVTATLGKQAPITIVDTYDTELMGVLIGSPRLHEINTERTELIRNLDEAASLSLYLEEILTEVERGIRALQYLIDPENN